MTKVNIDYTFRIDTVGVKSVNGYDGVVCEIRYYFMGTINNTTKERYYVLPIDNSKITTENFKPLYCLTKEDLLGWIEKSIEEKNLMQMKQSMYDLFFPEVTYLNLEYFKPKSWL